MSDNVFDFTNTDDLAPEYAELVAASVQANPTRDQFLDLLKRAPRALTYKELYVAGVRMGFVTDKIGEDGQPVVGEDGKVVQFPAVSSVANWLRSTSYGVVQIKRGYYAMKGSDADNGERYEHVTKDGDAGEEVVEAAPAEIDDLEDL